MILRNNENARSSDKILIIEVEKYCKENKFPIPAYETITRCRRKLNEEGLYLPSENVMKGRREKETFFRESARKGLL